MTVKLLTKQHLEFLSLKSSSEFTHIVGNHMSWLICSSLEVIGTEKKLCQTDRLSHSSVLHKLVNCVIQNTRLITYYSVLLKLHNG